VSTAVQVETQELGSAGVSRRKPVGRLQGNVSRYETDRPPGVGDLPEEVRDRLSDELVDELLVGAAASRRSSGSVACRPI
jgi:hypothetical protein